MAETEATRQRACDGASAAVDPAWSAAGEGGLGFFGSRPRRGVVLAARQAIAAALAKGNSGLRQEECARGLSGLAPWILVPQTLRRRAAQTSHDTLPAGFRRQQPAEPARPARMQPGQGSIFDVKSLLATVAEHQAQGGDVADGVMKLAGVKALLDQAQAAAETDDLLHPFDIVDDVSGNDPVDLLAHLRV